MEVPAPETGGPPREVTAATALQAAMVQAAHLPMRIMIQIRRVMIQIVQVTPRTAARVLRAVTEAQALRVAAQALQVVMEVRVLQTVMEAQVLQVAVQAPRVAVRALQAAAAARVHQAAARVLRQKPALLPPMQNHQENQNPGNRKSRR